jgi:Rrf2 family nitric oxide-sensitive transcriptional repressor
MKLNLSTDLSLKTLMFTAVQARRVSNLEIAQAFDSSREHLRKVIHQLSVWGYINTFPGRNGGLEIARSPDEIRIGELVKLCESDPLIDCDKQGCLLLPDCSLLNALDNAQKAFYDTLDCYTLTHLLAQRETRVKLAGGE